MTMSVEHRLMVYQSLLHETERDAARIAAELILKLTNAHRERCALASELEQEAEEHSGPRGKILERAARRVRKSMQS